MTTPKTDISQQAGEILLESAILKFLATAEPETKTAFTEFTQSNQDSPSLLQDIEKQFPAFAALLLEEAQHMQSDLASVTSE